ncbi:hypothetical protein DPMN_113399 [Dreissena polymorpha]|uniref:Uncharacterized protein n=1 Tax=Dreissena polymorpha TaxID=45954 RepID=A0A9D4KIC5_DREPO|nr:hypothetical protein DPMN_113399 [Dreissena polymorpha]
MEEAQMMASVQAPQSIQEHGSLMEQCKWGNKVEFAPVVLEWISARNVELSAFDSHDHLDSSSKVTKAGSIDGLVGLTPHVPLRIDGGIAVFSNQPIYPREYPCVTGFESAVGVQPKGR